MDFNGDRRGRGDSAPETLVSGKNVNDGCSKSSAKPPNVLVEDTLQDEEAPQQLEDKHDVNSDSMEPFGTERIFHSLRDQSSH